MDGFEVIPGQKLRVNILTDGPRDQSGYGGNQKEDDLGEDTTHTYLHSAQDKAALMQKLAGQRDPSMLLNM